jgi:lipid-A-disaccharide synthase-like uncharacterized protein
MIYLLEELGAFIVWVVYFFVARHDGASFWGAFWMANLITIMLCVIYLVFKNDSKKSLKK